MSNIAVKWTGKDSQMFIGRDTFGHVIMSGSWPKDDPNWQEWKATKPSDLLLLSLASCSAYDVVMILGRQRQNLVDLYISVDGQQAAEGELGANRSQEVDPTPGAGHVHHGQAADEAGQVSQVEDRKRVCQSGSISR